MTKESPCEWLPPLVGFVKLNFDGCFLGNLVQLGIWGLIRDHYSRVLRAFFKPTGQGLAIEVEILAHLEGWLLVKALGFFNFLVEGDYAIVISWATKKERGRWKFDVCLH